MSSAIETKRTRILDGHKICMLGGYGFQGQVTAGDGSDKQGKMGAGYNNLTRKKKKQQCKVLISNQPELATFLLVLCYTLIEEPLLYLCDNQSLLKTVNRWIGEGGKATLVGARGYSGSIHQDTTKENYSRDRNLLGQSESASRKTSE